ncbi:CRISPR-associated endonuclease Cas2 [Leptospira kirschneri]|uniref:CRISPR-associated endoribonuclease Cas2 n=1 Tax=Leptospira kirschneri str. 200802841 TaxID=1193047 RepID=A0A828Y497_9LEPT|nr:CRISPR-associated endonuclease Cas2 [Leptospira kirschneri]EKO52619.1 CRISPR-associated endoribonuclease Cas2 [Leptospira kirschneri str. 200802841]EKO61605.1 CRISPR-associated endoribonuclease Cas2 [Leptospira kirschneri str. H2]KON77213.1 CRISPR-associated endoribonuclease Cas2 [Leptospira kirschneri serovar Mozdok]KPZ76943.1 CRISPR-associated protein Cas2 [Leptospira kirschneri serovar Mozdok]NDK05216.1 CRISPR-associated endoribonuclease Cas2 [Leptospira kirschneri serovar Mozdok]
MKHWRLVTYDIREPKRLRQVAKIMEGFGERIQYSVFRIYSTDRELEKLRWKLAKVIEKEDDVFYLTLCAKCASGAHTQEKKSAWPDAPNTLKIL